MTGHNTYVQDMNDKLHGAGVVEIIMVFPLTWYAKSTENVYKNLYFT